MACPTRSEHRLLEWNKVPMSLDRVLQGSTNSASVFQEIIEVLIYVGLFTQVDVEVGMWQAPVAPAF